MDDSIQIQIKNYAICRIKLNQTAFQIDREIEQLYGPLNAPSISQLENWIEQLSVPSSNQTPIVKQEPFEDDSLEENIKKIQFAIENLKLKNKNLNFLLQQSVKSKQELQESLSSQEEINKQLNSVNCKSIEQIQSLRQENDKIKDDLAKFENSDKILTDEITNLKKQISQHNIDKKKQLEKDASNIQAFNKIKNESKSYHERVKQLDLMLKNETNIRIEFEANYNKLNIQLENQNKELIDLQKLKENEYDQFSLRVSSLETKASKFLSTENSLKQSIKELEAENSKSKQEQSQLVEQNENLLIYANLDKEELKKEQMKSQALEIELEKLNQQINDLSHSIEQKQKEIEELKKDTELKIKDLTGKIEMSHVNVQLKSKKIQSLEQKLKTTESDAANFNKELEINRVTIQKLNEEIKQVTSENDKLLKELKIHELASAELQHKINQEIINTKSTDNLRLLLVEKLNDQNKNINDLVVKYNLGIKQECIETNECLKQIEESIENYIIEIDCLKTELESKEIMIEEYEEVKFTMNSIGNKNRKSQSIDTKLETTLSSDPRVNLKRSSEDIDDLNCAVKRSK